MKRLLVAAACALCVLAAQASVVTSIPEAMATPIPSQFVYARQGAQTFVPGDVWTSNGLNGDATEISVYDAAHPLIGTKVLDFSTDSGLVNQGAYLGLLESSASISYFRMSGAYIGGTNFSIAGSPAPVPVPEPYVMLLVGIGLLGLKAQRRKTRCNNRHPQ